MTITRRAPVILLLCCSIALPALDQLPDAAQLDQEYTKVVRPLLGTYCLRCHGEARQKGDVRFDTLDQHISEKNAPTWTTARNVLDVSAMPPGKAAQPTREQRERLRKWIAGSIERFEADHQESQGNVLLRRINLRAYQNMMRTLTGLRPDVSDLQQDGTLHRFDTAGTAIYLTQDQLAQFFACAQRTLAEAAAARSTQGKAVDQAINLKAYRQGYGYSEMAEFEKFLAAHSDPTGFAAFRDQVKSLPGRIEREAILKVVIPAICAAYGKQSVAEVEAAGIDWSHDPVCMTTVLERLRAAGERFRKHIDEISEFQPMGPWSTSSPNSGFGLTRLQIETPGSYRLSAIVRTYKAGCPMPMKFMADGRTVQTFLVEAPPEAPQAYAATVFLRRGEHKVDVASTLPLGEEGNENHHHHDFVFAHFGVRSQVSFRNGSTFLDDPWEPLPADLRYYDWRKPEGPFITVKEFRLQGPLPTEAEPTALDAALSPDAASDPTRENAERRILAFMQRAYAGGCDAETAKPFVDVVMAHFARNKDFAKALSYGLAAVLSSPRFLFLEEAQRGESGKRRPLEGRELARRLAYFLWSDLPDAELQSAAESGALRDQLQLAAEVRRMLMDPRSSAFRDAFTAQWLRIDRLDSIVIPYELHPGFDTSLLESAKRESVAFFSELLDHDLSVMDFIDCDFAVVNNRLAMHYGIPGVSGTGFRRVALPPGTHRGGVLGQTSVLMATSNGMTSSLVRRGAFIMEQLLGMPPGVPPPNVPALNAVKDPDPEHPLTQRERLAQHRSVASCARCHDKIDALGVGLENFDAIGSWGDQLRLLVTAKNGKLAWNPQVAEVAGQLPDGEAYDGADALRARLKQQPERFLRRLAENLLIYALGRDLQQSDGPDLDAICARVAKSGYGLSTLIEQLVLSEQFRAK